MYWMKDEQLCMAKIPAHRLVCAEGAIINMYIHRPDYVFMV